MTFEVREFDFDPQPQTLFWNFKLTNVNPSQLDFYSQEASSRSLFHLAQDLILQLDQSIQKRHKKEQNKNRIVRKLCEKMIKELRVNIQSFAKELEEEKENVLDYFGKKIKDEAVLQRIEGKCKQWTLAMLVSMQPEEFYRITHRFMNSYYRDGKRGNPDFQSLTEVSLITVGDNFHQQSDTTKQDNDNLILVDVNLNINQKYISESFLWDSQQISNIQIKLFTNHFLSDLLKEKQIDMDKDAYQEAEKDARTQIRAQILYKTLLRKYASILLNFSSMEIPSEVKQYLILVNLKLQDEKGLAVFEDQFQWDILNEQNNVEQFVTQLVQDYKLDHKYISELCFKIRTQINNQLEWKFQLLVKTFRSIHKDRQSPKLNTQTITVLKRNLAFAMDVNMPQMNDRYTINPQIYFNNSDLFSLLSRNMDILPEEFQEILMCKQTKLPQKQANKISKDAADQMLKRHGQFIETNPYLQSISNSNNLHSLWRKTLLK